MPNALSTGVVDGQENPVGVIHNNGLHSLQKYMTLDGPADGSRNAPYRTAALKRLALP